MNCSRCGAAEAVVKRDAAFYCAKCALARDWEEVIALVQEERVDVGPTVDFGATPTVSAGTPAIHTELEGNTELVGAPVAAPAAAPAAPAPPQTAPPSNGDSPADPFA